MKETTSYVPCHEYIAVEEAMEMLPTNIKTQTKNQGLQVWLNKEVLKLLHLSVWVHHA